MTGSRPRSSQRDHDEAGQEREHLDERQSVHPIPFRFGMGGFKRPTVEEATLYFVVFLVCSTMWVLPAFASIPKGRDWLPPRVITYDEGGMVRTDYLPRIHASISAGQVVEI